jgi:hypothetical protein
MARHGTRRGSRQLAVGSRRKGLYRVSGTERVAVGSARRRATHGTRACLNSHRVAGAENRSKRSDQEALVEIDRMGAKKIAVLLGECVLPVMLRLPLDVGPDAVELRRTHRECRVTVLPMKILDLASDPLGGSLLGCSKHFGEAMGGLQARKQVHVIRNTTDFEGSCSELSEASAKILVHPSPLFV